MAAPLRGCKDCHSPTRPAIYPGPRCATCWRAEKKRRKINNRMRHVEKKFQLSPRDYQAILDSQHGLCFVCRRAKDSGTKHLAVDHEHNKPGCDHPPDVGCRECVRCLACTTCNRIVLGRYDVAALKRAIEVFEDPPARRLLHDRFSITR